MTDSQSLELDNDALFQEWRACRESLAQFDKIIVDLRKFGFGLITILLSANGFLFTASNISVVAILGIYIALLILIFGLFRLDRVHEVFVRAAVIRAMQLEEIARPSASVSDNGKMALSWQISYWSEKLKTATWGHYLYIFFCFAAYTLALAGILSVKGYNCDLIKVYLLAAGAIGLVSIVFIFISHCASRPMHNSFICAIKKRQFEFGYEPVDENPHIWADRISGFIIVLLFIGICAGSLCVNKIVMTCELPPDSMKSLDNLLALGNI